MVSVAIEAPCQAVLIDGQMLEVRSSSSYFRRAGNNMPAASSPGGRMRKLSRGINNLASVIDQLKSGLREWPTDARAWVREHGFELGMITAIWAVLSVLIFWL